MPLNFTPDFKKVQHKREWQGAHYPWETAPSDGHDAAVAPTDWSEQHISLDVALGTVATARALNDSDFNRETAFPIVSNVAGANLQT